MSKLLVASVAFGYLLLLFAIAYYGDRRRSQGRSIIANPYIYTLSLAVYCTSWTFHGSVGKAANEGLSFLPIYIGPTLIAFLWWFLLRKLVRVCKENHVTTMSDFLTLRYGKGALLGAIVTVGIILADMPYIGLQLKAISTTYDILVGAPEHALQGLPFYLDHAFYIALILAVFGSMFGARRLDPGERHEGLVAAVAFESIVKLVAFLAVGLLVSYVLFPGIGEIFRRVTAQPAYSHLFLLNTTPNNSYLLMFVETVLSMWAIILLPRQFHMGVVENTDEKHILTASWLLPVYLFLINFFVLPLAFGGLLLGRPPSQGDTFVLRLPLDSGHPWIALLAFVGGLSAATAMVMVASITLSTMFLNSLVLPFLAKFWRERDWTPWLLPFKRLGIVLVILLGYLSYRTLGPLTMLVEMGLIAFLGVMQLAPAIVGALYWRRATGRGAIAGLSAGFLIWAYTLLLPYLVNAGWFSPTILTQGPLGLHFLRPTALLGLTDLHPLSHAFFWSMFFNVGLFCCVSMVGTPRPAEDEQAQRFVEVYSPLAELGLEPRLTNLPEAQQFVALAAKFVGPDKAQQALQQFVRENRLPGVIGWSDADKLKLRDYVERLVGGSVGPAAAKVVVDGYLATRGSRIEGVFDLFGEVSHSLEESREALKKRISELSLLTEAAQTSTSILSLTQILESILTLLMEKFSIEQCSIRLLDEDGVLRLKSSRGAALVDLEKMDLIPDMTTLTGQCLLTRTVISIPDTQNLSSREVTGLAPDETLASFIQVPLATESQVLGVLTAASRTQNFFSPEQLDFYRSLANQVSLAIQNARLYEKIIRFSKDLETKVAERTLELKNKSLELTEANRALKELDQLKTEFLANVSHELRTPLNSILGYTQLLLDGVDGPLNEEQKKSLQRVETASHRLLQLINDVLDLSKMRAGKMELHPEKTTLHEILEETIQTIDPLARTKDIEIVVEESFIPVLTVDRAKIIQVLLNLLSNAVKFTDPHGRVTVSTQVMNLPEGPGVIKEYAAVKVTDTGIGIKEGDLTDIFKEFVQADTSATRLHGGTGLGLPICRKLVEMHHGRIWVESEYGRGSTFTFILPLEETEPETAAAPGEAPVPGRLVLGLTRRGGLIHLLRETLTPMGFAFHADAMLDNLLEQLKTARPAALIVDLLAHDGKPLADIVLLRANPLTRDLPIFPVAFAEDGRSGLVMGPAEFINQPCASEEFSRSLNNLAPWVLFKEALVLEIDKQAAALWEVLLSDEGFEVVLAVNGEEAIRHLENVLPGLVVLSLALSGVDLVRVIEFIRFQGETRDVPLLCLLPRDLDIKEQRALQQYLRQMLKAQKFPLNNFVSGIKRFFSQFVA